jgi:hypothetical protein
MLCFVILSVEMLYVVILTVIMLCVVMLTLVIHIYQVFYRKNCPRHLILTSNAQDNDISIRVGTLYDFFKF